MPPLPDAPPARRSSRPSIPNLHIVISDKTAFPKASSELDSGYYSAVSATRDLKRASTQPTPEPSPPLTRTSPNSSSSGVFATTDPSNAPQSVAQDTIVEEPENLLIAPPSSLSRKNMKKLSLTSLDTHPQLRPATSNMSMKSVAPNTVPMSLPPSPHLPHRKLSVQPLPSIAIHEAAAHPERDPLPTRRRSSVMSLPPFSTQAKPARTKYTTGRRAIEDDAETDAYADGPVEILPGVWLGAEDNATDWSALAERSIGAVLNVAKEVILSFEEEPNSPQHWSDDASIKDDISRGRHYAANDDTGRPDLLYLHLPWSHGQNDLVNVGFLQAMSFIDRCIASKIGVLIHCQCGISRSATLVIAYVMRAAQSPTAVPEVAKMKKEGMQGAYDFVKAKSQTIGPNMSLIYQLLEYDRVLSPNQRGPGSDTSQDSAEAEWTRQRMAMDLQDQEELPRATSPDAMSDASNALEAAEARELDQRMQARREQRSSSRASNHSLLSVVEETHDEHGSVAWKSRYGHGLALNPAASLHSITGSSRTRGLSIGSDISGRSSLVSGTDSVLEEDEDAETSDSPYSASRKDSGDLEGAGDETFVQLPPSNRPAPTILLAPIPTNPRKRGSLASLQSTSTRSLASSSGRSSPAFSRRSSELGPPPSARPEQTSFGAAAQFLPPPSSRPDQTSFSIHPPSSSSAQPVIGFPPLSARRRSIDAPSLGPPPVRSHTLSHSSRLRPLDPVPPSPIRGTEQESENDSRPPAPAPAPAAPKPEKKMKPKPLQIAVQPKSTTIEIERSSVDDLPKTASGHKHTLSSSSIGSVASSNSSRSASSSRASGSTSASGSKSRGGRLASLKTRAPQMNVVGSATPHQTLFIFPPSPQRFDTILSPDGHSSSYAIPATPSTMLLRMEPGGLPSSVVSSRASSRSASISSTSSIGSVADSLASVSTTSSRRRRVHALPSGVTPTIAAFRHRTFGTAVLPSTPTTATAHVEARGWVGSAGANTAGSGHAPAGAAELLSPLSPLTARAGARNSFGF